MIPAGRTCLAAAIAIGGLGLAAQTGAPPQMKQLQVNNVNLSYVQQGKGDPVVFVHGAIGDLRFWEPQRQAFASRHEFIAYTYRYHGTAPWPDDGSQYTAKAHAADLAILIATLKGLPVHVVGLSYGGILATMLALEHPELVRSLTLAEPALFSLLAESAEGKLAIEEFNKGIEPVTAQLKAGDVSGALKMFHSVISGEGPESFDKLPAPFRQMLLDNQKTLALVFAASLPPITCDALRAVKQPTMVVGGERTRKYFSAINDAVIKCVPGSRLVIIPNASHPMSYENPPAFNDAVLKFVGQH